MAIPGVSQSFVVTFDSDTLNAGMSVYDFTGSVPVLVSGPTAMDLFYGTTYVGSFTPLPNREYLIFKAVYTDNTFATLDSNYFESSEAIGFTAEVPFAVSFDSPGLPVALSIYDDSPALIYGPIAMTNVVGNTYVGKYTPDPTKSYLVITAVYTDNTFTILDDNYSQGSSSLFATQLTPPTPDVVIDPCKYVALPNMAGALYEWLQAMQFQLITKTVVNFQVVETATALDFNGVWQPFSAEQLKLKPEGQRSWSWWMLHSLTEISLQNDDVVEYSGKNFRVMEQNDYACYGYFEYHLVEDWTGSGPTVVP